MLLGVVNILIWAWGVMCAQIWHFK